MVDHSAQEAAQKAGFYAIHIRYEPLTKVTTNFVQSLTYISKEYDQNKKDKFEANMFVVLPETYIK